MCVCVCVLINFLFVYNKSVRIVIYNGFRTISVASVIVTSVVVVVS